MIRRLDLREEGIVIGGQALNYLFAKYADPSEFSADAVLASKDLDYQSTDSEVRKCANRIQVQLEVPEATTKTELIGVMRIPLETGVLCRVDFLRKPFGLESRNVTALKVQFDLDEHTPLFVMHPLHCLESRTRNVAQLPHQYANDLGLDQLRAAIVMTRGFIRSSDIGGEDQVVKACAWINQFCHQDCSLEVYRDHRIDVFEAIPIDMLPQTVLEKGYPHWVRQIGDRREKFAKAPKRIY